MPPDPSLTVRTSKFRSRFEATLAQSLAKRGLEYEYETKALAYTVQSIYTPDFILPNGVIVEAKGLFDSSDRRKMLAVKAQHPGLDIRLCFMKADVKLSRAPRSITYWQWAERHGFLWCEKHIPTSWYGIQVPEA